jgi:uncharacterized protein YciI
MPAACKINMLEGVERAREAHGARLARDGERGRKRKAGRRCDGRGRQESLPVRA